MLLLCHYIFSYDCSPIVCETSISHHHVGAQGGEEREAFQSYIGIQMADKDVRDDPVWTKTYGQVTGNVCRQLCMDVHSDTCCR